MSILRWLGASLLVLCASSAHAKVPQKLYQIQLGWSPKRLLKQAKQKRWKKTGEGKSKCHHSLEFESKSSEISIRFRKGKVFHIASRLRSMYELRGQQQWKHYLARARRKYGAFRTQGEMFGRLLFENKRRVLTIRYVKEAHTYKLLGFELLDKGSGKAFKSCERQRKLWRANRAPLP